MMEKLRANNNNNNKKNPEVTQKLSTTGSNSHP